MVFHSILYERATDNTADETLEAPDFFGDLNLDQIVDAITARKQPYNLKPFFYSSLHDIDAIKYRHEVMQDLENGMLLQSIERFAQRMAAMRDSLALANKLYYEYQKKRLFLSAVETYCEAINGLVQDIEAVELRSRGFLAFRDYITRYARSAAFTSLVTQTREVKAKLASIKYCLRIKGNAITVRKYESEADYSAEVEETFQKFKQGAVKDYRIDFPSRLEMNHVEAQILTLVARLFPDEFSALDTYCVRNRDFLDETIRVFDREVQFYVAYLEYIALFKRAGLKFCYPAVSNCEKQIYDYEGFDLALARRLLSENSPVVCNDFFMKDGERILVVSGPNQGGKTTFARTFGQLHYLASLGCPVAGREAKLFLFDRLFTHFEQEENIANLRGKLQDDLIRIHDILDQATPDSIIIMNEIFTSTTLEDAISLGKKILEQIMQLDLLCVCVTFIDEWASLNEKTVSMVSTVVPENPALRTYKIVRKPADGLAYAISIAEKYQLTYERIKERINHEGAPDVQRS